MTKKLMFVLAMLLVATVALAQQSPSGQGPTVLNGGIIENPGGFPGSGPNNQKGPGLGRHDLQDANTGNPIGCESCHLPHTAPTYGGTFLWAWSIMPTNLTTYYTTLNSNVVLLPPPKGSSGALPTGNARSMLCFSCHDAASASSNGVIASVTYNGVPYPLTSGTTPTLDTQHPVDAQIPTTTDYVQPSVSSGLMYGAVATIGVDALPLWSSGGTTPRVECMSCHDVHNDWPTAQSACAAGIGGIPFLRQCNTYGTYLCRECHNAQ